MSGLTWNLSFSVFTVGQTTSIQQYSAEKTGEQKLKEIESERLISGLDAVMKRGQPLDIVEFKEVEPNWIVGFSKKGVAMIGMPKKIYEDLLKSLE